MEEILPIYTERLVLRDFVREDIPAIVKIAISPRFAGYRQFRPGHIIDDVNRFVDDAIKWKQPDAETDEREHWRLAVCLKSEGNPLIGYSCLWGWSGQKASSPELGYFLDPVHQHRGYTTEASEALIRLFQERNPRRPIFSMAHPANIPSQNVLTRSGFKETGTTVIDVQGRAEPRITFRLDPK